MKLWHWAVVAVAALLLLHFGRKWLARRRALADAGSGAVPTGGGAITDASGGMITATQDGSGDLPIGTHLPGSAYGSNVGVSGGIMNNTPVSLVSVYQPPLSLAYQARLERLQWQSRHWP